MTTPARLQPLASPPAPAAPTADVVESGPTIPAIDRIKLFSAVQWEEFVLEWADSLRDAYAQVARCGGAGDMGRDVVAIAKDGGRTWDNFQCKHYLGALAPSDVWLEIGKLAYYTARGDFSWPRRYHFIAPQGAGIKLSKLLSNADALRAGLIENWATYCRTAITSTAIVELDAALRAHIDAMNFSIFEATPPLKIIDAHARTRWYAARFGGGLPPRPPVPAPPTQVADAETVFVRALLDAYADHLKRLIAAPEALAENADLREHFGDARLEFYSAEALRTFSRDTLPPNAFEKLQEEVESGIRDEIRSDHSDGYRRVLAVVKTARTLPLGSHALHKRMHVRDHGGVCHQLANDGKVRWVK